MASTPTPEQIEVYAATLRARNAETARRRHERCEQAGQWRGKSVRTSRA